MQGDISISEWKKNGRHRLYANTSDGNTLGYLDMVTGRVVLEPGAAPEPVTTMLQAEAFRRSSKENGDRRRTSTHVGTGSASPEPAWTDLALNKPGQGIRARAEAARHRENEISRGFAALGRIFDVNTPERAWRLGAQGEARVGKLLDEMAEYGWRTLHSIPIGPQSDIDHLSIGPGGIIAFSTKHHPRAKLSVSAKGIFVNGAYTNYVQQAKDHARLAYGRLSARTTGVPFVTPWVVLVNGGLLQPELKGRFRPDGISVTTNWNLKINMRRMDDVLSAERIDEIYEVARRSTTWLEARTNS